MYGFHRPALWIVLFPASSSVPLSPQPHPFYLLRPPGLGQDSVQDVVLLEERHLLTICPAVAASQVAACSCLLLQLQHGFLQQKDRKCRCMGGCTPYSSPHPPACQLGGMLPYPGSSQSTLCLCAHRPRQNSHALVICAATWGGGAPTILPAAYAAGSLPSQHHVRCPADVKLQHPDPSPFVFCGRFTTDCDICSEGIPRVRV